MIHAYVGSCVDERQLNPFGSNTSVSDSGRRFLDFSSVSSTAISSCLSVLICFL